MADSTNHAGDGDDENDEKVLVSRKMHQVSAESALLILLLFFVSRPQLSCHCAETGGAAEAAAAAAEAGAGG